MEQQRVRIGENGKLEILNSKTIYNDGKLEVVIEGDYLIDADDIVKLLAKDEKYLIANFRAFNSAPYVRMLVDKAIHEDLVKVLLEYERDRENMIKAALERNALKKENQDLKEQIQKLRKKNDSWF